jgi:hypothetical protein
MTRSQERHWFSVHDIQRGEGDIVLEAEVILLWFLSP